MTSASHPVGRLAVSNLAWQRGEDVAIADALMALQVRGVEIAPTMVWDDPLSVPDAEVDRYRAFWNERGIRIVAMQSLLFGRDHLRIFGNAADRRRTVTYLERMIRLGARLGADVLVFGSPRNRSISGRRIEEISGIAASFFRTLGRAAADAGVVIGIEPNPPAYGCDFLMTSAEALAFLMGVNSSGLGLHLDAAGMTLVGEPIPQAIAAALPTLRHYHVSEPFLAQIGTGGVLHGIFARALADGAYDGWISIETRATKPDGNVDAVSAAVHTTRHQYAAWLTGDRFANG